MPSSIITSHPWEAPYEVSTRKPFKSADFDGYKRIITDLYITEDHSLDAVMKIMAERYDFYGNEAQYKKKLRLWRLDEKLPQRTALYRVRKKDQRHAAGKGSMPVKTSPAPQSHTACLTPPLSPKQMKAALPAVAPVTEITPPASPRPPTVDTTDTVLEKNGDMEWEASTTREQSTPSQHLGLSSENPQALFDEAVDLLEHDRYVRASGYLTSALSGFESQPSSSPQVSQVVANMGLVYSSQGEYTKALEFYNRASPGLEGHNRAGLLTNMGIIYDRQGDYTRALETHQSALQDFRKLTGGDTPEVLAAYNNIGIVHRKKGDHFAALSHHYRVLEGSEKAGDDRSCAMSLNNIGAVYHAEGKHEIALRFYMASLARHQTTLFGDNMDMLTTFHNIGVIYDAQGRYQEAVGFFRRALSGYEKTHGDNSRDTLETLRNLGNVYFKMSYYQRAVEIYKREWMGKRKVLGTKNSETGKAKQRFEQANSALARQRLSR